jgi:hypothetical protein
LVLAPAHTLLGSCYRHNLYLPHREKKVRKRKKKKRQTVIVTVSAAGGGEKGGVNYNNDNKTW